MQPIKITMSDERTTGSGLAAAHGSAFIALSGDIRHDSPLAWMVFCHHGEHDYMVFTERRDAEYYAEEQAEAAELPEHEHWPMYALWGADIGVMPNDEAQRRRDREASSATET